MGYTPHVLVIGGGAVGTATARDLAIRGLDVTLVDQGTLASGRTGRMRGILYSGAQFTPLSESVAKQCIEENRTLFEIAESCIRDTGGLIVEHNDDDPDTLDEIREACDSLGIATTELTAADAKAREPGLSDDIERALLVADAVVDPFSLAIANSRDARSYGATIKPHAEVIDITVEDETIRSVTIDYDPSPAGRPPDEALRLPSSAVASEIANESGPDGEPATESGKPKEVTEFSRPDDAGAVDAAEESKDSPTEPATDDGPPPEPGSADDPEDETATSQEPSTDTGKSPEGAQLDAEGSKSSSRRGDSLEPPDPPDLSAEDREPPEDSGTPEPVPENTDDLLKPPEEPPEPPGPDESHGPPDSGVPSQTTEGQIPGMGSEETEQTPTGEIEELEPDYIINAAGVRAEAVANLADLSLPLTQEREALVITADRLVETVTTRLSDDGVPDSITPYGKHAILGHSVDPTDEEGSSGLVQPSSVDETVSALGSVSPDVDDSRVLRTMPGMRSTITDHDIPAASGLGYRLIDHEDQHDCWGMTTVLGGTVTTHRYVAERVVDRICETFGIQRECQTADLQLPAVSPGTINDYHHSSIPTAFADPESRTSGGGDPFDPGEVPEAETIAATSTADESTTDEQPAEECPNEKPTDEDSHPNEPLLCECQGIPRSNVRDAFRDETGSESNLEEVRLRTGATMGDCQGGHCAHRIADELYPEYERATVDDALVDLLNSRWQGQRPAPEGSQLQQAARNYQLQAGTLGRKYESPAELDLATFDSGPPLGIPGRLVMSSTLTRELLPTSVDVVPDAGDMSEPDGESQLTLPGDEYLVDCRSCSLRGELV